MNKIVANSDEAIRDVFDGATIMIGGFGLCGTPENLIRALARKGTKNLRTISNNVGVDGVGNGLLLAAGQIAHHIGTYVGENRLLEEMVLKGTIRLDLIPQGTFSDGRLDLKPTSRVCCPWETWENGDRARKVADAQRGKVFWFLAKTTVQKIFRAAPLKLSRSAHSMTEAQFSKQFQPARSLQPIFQGPHASGRNRRIWNLIAVELVEYLASEVGSAQIGFRVADDPPDRREQAPTAAMPQMERSQQQQGVYSQG